ncbi:MAG TPA: tetratricopeptide repeat protein, partial [Candidatus Hydrogenedentes bacterium]|nr:tetratricopeptide repeat protein [Candidatus Hydrogenedentota bacterium]
MRFIIVVFAAGTGMLLLGIAAAQAPASQDRGALTHQLREQEALGAATTSDEELQRRYIATLTALGYHDLVAEQYVGMLRRQSDNPSLWRLAGEAWMRVGPYGRNKAFEALKKAQALDAEAYETLFLLAHLYHHEGLYAAAEDLYEAVLAKAPEHTRALLGRAVLMARNGDIAEASRSFDEIGAAAQEYDVEARIMLRKALFDFERRGGWFEDNAANHAAYARLLYRAGRLTDALMAARRAVAHNEDDYRTWNFIAAMSLQIGNLENAEQAYGKSLAANPD